MAKPLIMLCLVLLAASTSAKACSPCTQYYYINGVSEAAASITGPQGLREAAGLLEKRLKSSSDFQSSSDIIYLKNPSQGLFADIFEKLVTQKQLEKNLSFAQALQDEMRYSDGAPSYTPSSDDASLFQQAVNQLLTEQESSEYANVIGPTLDADYQTVLATMQQGVPVTIVAHSEGNMYANEIWSKLAYSTQNGTYTPNLPPGFWSWLQLDNIATPAGVAPSGFYGTETEDAVIGWLSNLLDTITGDLPALPANWQFTDPLKYDALGHGFISVYLNPAVDTDNLLPQLISKSNAALTAPVPVVSFLYRTVQGGGGLVLQEPDGTYIDVSTASPYSYLYTSDLQEGTYQLYTTMTPYESLETSVKEATLSIGFLSPDPNSTTLAENASGGGFKMYPAAPPGQLIPLGSFTVTKTARGIYSFQAALD